VFGDRSVGRLRVREERDNAEVAFLEPSTGALAEDEICGTFDVGLCVELAADVGEEGVLVAG
jgi:hypothetical protein